jgi:hypothetical protein
LTVDTISPDAVSKYSSEERLTFDVVGRRMTVEAGPDGWKAYWSGNDGTRRPAGVQIPSDLGADEIAVFLDDLSQVRHLQSVRVFAGSERPEMAIDCHRER